MIEPALVGGLPVTALTERFAVVELESAVLVVVVAGARFTPSLTDAFGRAEAEDFSELTESGRVGTAVGDLAPAAAVLDAAADVGVGLDGTIEALRDGAGGALVVACLAGGGILVLVPGAGAALDVFLIVEVAVVGLVAVADDEVVALVAAVGAAFTAPAPNVPELRTWIIVESEVN